MSKASIKPGRNDPCPCGSGNKYKRCCGLERGAAVALTSLNPQEIGALVALIDQQHLSEAEHRARTLLTMHANAGMLWKILGVALMRQGKDALQALRRTTELMPNDGEAHGNLGAALHDRGQWAEALVSLRRALAFRPHDVEALVDAANALRALGRAREAVPLYQRALELEPRLAEAQNNLGNAFLELGHPDDALACYRCALQIKPDDVQILCNLGSAQKQLGLPDEAIASYGRALTLNPNYVEALNNLGLVLHGRGERREALALHARAVELDPKRAESHYNLGNVLFELRRLDEAAASYTQVLALEPQHAPAHLSLGVALRAQRRHTEAESSCQAALAIDPNYVEALSLLGELRADRGRFAEAEESFQRAIEINPDFSFAFSSIATHRKMTRDDTEWLKGAQALLAKRQPLGSEISLRYALGKYFDDVGEYDEAFEHYRQANELSKSQGSSYERAKLTRRVDEIISSFDAQFIRRCRTEGSTTQLPVFIVGMPRSGTSLTEQILASHPAVFGAGEVSFWDTAFIDYREADVQSKTATAPVGASLIARIAGDYLERLTAYSSAALRVVDKMPANFWYLGLIHIAIPQARIIHMQRHPIDTCLSIYFQNFFNMDPYANDFDNLAHYYGEYLRITDHWRAVLPATALLEVPYEALIEDQEGWTRRMLYFIGLPWDPKCLDFHETERVVITASKWQVRQKIHTASAGRWRNYEKYVAPLRHLVNLPS
jgi:tetratricopeptide (TPR) repeat protein